MSETETSFYLLGAYMSDGCILTKYNKFEISSKDTDWLEQIRDIICPTKPLFADKRSKCKTLRLTDSEIVNWFNSWGCTDRKSTTLVIGKPIPNKYIKDFLLGILDGDGCISVAKYKKIYKDKQYNYQNNIAYICSASEQFIMQIKNMAPQNIKCKIHKTKPSTAYIGNRKIISKPMYRLIFNGSNAIKFLTYLYSNPVKIKLNRKYQLFKSINASTSSLNDACSLFSSKSPT